MKRTPRFACLALALVLMLGMFAGCTGTPAQSAAPDQTSAAPETDASPDVTEPAEPDGDMAAPSGIATIIKNDPADMLWMRDTSPVTLSVFINRMNPEEFAWGNDITTQYITERTGVTLEIEYAPDSEGTRLNLMLAGGETLPDYIGPVHQSSAAAGDLVSGEYVLCAEDLINEYAPEMWSLFPLGEQQKLFASATDDGKMWAFTDGYGLDGESPYGYMHGYLAVRSDILAAMGKTNLDIKSLDDFYGSLDAFKQIQDQFPAVEYPVFLKGIRAQFSAFWGDIGAGDIRYNKQDDSFYFWFENEAGYNTLKMFNKLYRDGFLKEESIITSNSPIDDMGAGKAFYYFENNVWASSSANPPLQANVDENAWYMPCYPFDATGQRDTLRTFKGVANNGSAWWISADSQNVERAVAFLEYMTTEEGMLTLNCGPFGQTWDVAVDAKGYNYPQFIGEAGELAHNGKYEEAKAQFGFNPHQHGLWLYHEVQYNFLWNHDINVVNSILPQNMMDARTMWYSGTTDNADLTAVPNMVSVDSGSDAGVLLSTMQTIYNSELVKTVFTDSDAAFDQSYQAMLGALDSAGKDRFWDMYRPLFDEKLALYSSVVGN